jgi:hypothetical protein
MGQVPIDGSAALKLKRLGFSWATPEKLGLFSAFRWLRSSRGETEFFFTHATPEKLGLFSAYRWLCSSRRETEFFCLRHTRKTRSLLCFSMALFFQGRDRVFLPTPHPKNSVSSLLIDGFVLPGERPSFPRATPDKLGLLSAFRWLYSSRGETEFFPHATPDKLDLYPVSIGEYKRGRGVNNNPIPKIGDDKSPIQRLSLAHITAARGYAALNKFYDRHGHGTRTKRDLPDYRKGRAGPQLVGLAQWICTRHRQR